MKKLLLCVFILLVSVNVFASEVDIKQLTEKANSGDAEAQYQLGLVYITDVNGPKDYSAAVKWWTLAAEQNNPYAQIDLGFCYLYGYGVPDDFKLAYMWLSICLSHASNNFEYIQTLSEVLSKLEKDMTPTEIAEAEQMADEWMERHKQKDCSSKLRNGEFF